VKIGGLGGQASQRAAIAGKGGGGARPSGQETPAAGPSNRDPPPAL